MIKVKVYNFNGEAVEDLELDGAVFGVESKDELISQVYEAISANKRQVLAHTKTRGERAGSGIKPWRQKGTGRARVGSVRSPLWKKGGITFGPRKDRNFSKKITKKMNAVAIKAVLSSKLKDQELFIFDKMENSQNKTKEMAKRLANLKLKGTGLITFLVGEKDFRRSVRNLKNISDIITDQLNVFDMLNHRNLIMSKDSIKMIEKKYSKE